MPTYRIGIAGFLHESNTFLPAQTTADDFRALTWTAGEQMRERWQGALHELGGMFQGSAEEEMEAVPLFATVGVPSGRVTRAAFEEIVGEILGQLDRAGRLDGVLLALHGATVAEDFTDADGEVTRRVRDKVGAATPVVATLDLHANVSQEMVDNTDAIVIYKTNPHLDQQARGKEAARLLARTVRGEVRPVQALATPPWIVPIDRQYTAEDPARGLYALAEAAARQPGILSASIAMGFYYADVPEMGASFLAVADGDLALARQTAAWMAEQGWQRRHEFLSALLPVEQAVGQAREAAATPVALFDVGDNVGGGSAADSTVLLAELRRQGVERTVTLLWDPAGAAVCAAAGIGQPVDLPVGNPTFQLSGLVRTLSDGRFTEPEVRHGGWGIYDQGLTAVVEAPGSTFVVLTTRRMAPMSLEQVRSLGLRIEGMRAVVVKGVVAPRAAYGPVCAAMLMVDTPGVTAGNPAHFHYENRRHPMYPLEPDTTYGT